MYILCSVFAFFLVFFPSEACIAFPAPPRPSGLVFTNLGDLPGPSSFDMNTNGIPVKNYTFKEIKFAEV